MKKYAFITGASRGIGRAVSILLAKEGYHLYLNCHQSKELLYNLKEQLERQYSVSCQCFVGDIGSPGFVKECFAKIPQLDVLINNAGISHIGLFTDMSVDEWQKVLNTNLSSAFYTCKYAVPLMLHAHSGRIINISSVWGNIGASMEAAYSASKGGLNSFTKAIAKELAPSNIQVNAIACGVIDTEMNQCFSEEERRVLRDEIPADRFGSAEEAAQMVVSLLNAPDYLTGQIITLDGGWC
ncbi:MAG: SDR family NAD(P)-dependent oxidoreductase [Lachnospiraceae bacterium]|jgi:3-oxoacyl-[acyl-carrier protein] reductase|nr:SDR family NAD(P)-dependent oxidoreductase [Lachnospiraceae bacterium]